MKPCPICYGTLRVWSDCGFCNGQGYTVYKRPCYHCSGTDLLRTDWEAEQCEVCDGAGELERITKCRECNETGKRARLCTNCNVCGSTKDDDEGAEKREDVQEEKRRMETVEEEDENEGGDKIRETRKKFDLVLRFKEDEKRRDEPGTERR